MWPRVCWKTQPLHVCLNLQGVFLHFDLQFSANISCKHLHQWASLVKSKQANKYIRKIKYVKEWISLRSPEMLRKNKTSLWVLFYDAQGITTFQILATVFSEFKLLHILYKWPALYQVPMIVAYSPVPSLKTNVGLFFCFCTLQELWHWQDDQFIQHSEDSNLFHPTHAGEDVFFHLGECWKVMEMVALKKGQQKLLLKSR